MLHRWCRPPARGSAVLVAGPPLRGGFSLCEARQPSQCGERCFPTGTKCVADDLPKLLLGNFLDSQLGDDHRIPAAQGASGSFELNVMLPVIARNLLESMRWRASRSATRSRSLILGISIILVDGLPATAFYPRNGAIAQCPSST